MRQIFFGLALLGLMACQPTGMRLNAENESPYVFESTQQVQVDDSREYEVYAQDLNTTNVQSKKSLNQTPSPDDGSSEDYLAYRYNYVARMPHDSIKATTENHIEICQNAGRSKCQILHSNLSRHSNTNVDASISFRADPIWLKNFFEQLQSDVQSADGKIISNTVSIEDLTTAILDSDARLQAQMALRDRIKNLLETQDGKLADLLAIETELARVQGEIESATAIIKALRARIAMSQVDIRYRSKNVAVNGNTFSEVSYAFKSFLRTTMNGLGSVILFIAFVLPWFIFLILPGFFLIRKFWRRRKKA